VKIRPGGSFAAATVNYVVVMITLNLGQNSTNGATLVQIILQK